MPLIVRQHDSKHRRLPESQGSESLERRAAGRPDGVDAGVEAAWSVEIGRRIQEIDTGKVKGVPAEVVFARALKILGR